jgi:hypothetical protein
MKKVLLTLCLMLGVTFVNAQRLNLYSSYAFDDKVDSYYSSTDYYEGTIKGGYQWGAGIEFSPRPDYAAELMYLRQDTQVPLRYQTGLGSVQSENLELDLNYILLSAGRTITAPSNENIEGFGNILLGCGFGDVSNGASERSATKFAWGLRLGANVFASESVGIKLHVLMLSLVQGAGGGFYFGTGGGGVGVSTYSSMYQFAVGGALILRKPQ